jgi:hypothetical protein
MMVDDKLIKDDGRRRKEGRKTTTHHGGWVVVVEEEKEEEEEGLMAQDKVSEAGVRVPRSEKRKTCSASQKWADSLFRESRPWFQLCRLR